MNKGDVLSARKFVEDNFFYRSELVLNLLGRVRDGKDLIGAEVGIFRGEFIGYLLRNKVVIRKIYCIDPYEVYTVLGRQLRGWTQVVWDNLYIRVKKDLSIFGYRIEWIREKAEQCVDSLPKLDFVELDGNHSYESVFKELHLYEKKIVSGGLFFGHDYYGKHSEGVQKAVNQYAFGFGRDLHSDERAMTWWWYVP
jgi:hypothetical protein